MALREHMIVVVEAVIFDLCGTLKYIQKIERLKVKIIKLRLVVQPPSVRSEMRLHKPEASASLSLSC